MKIKQQSALYLTDVIQGLIGRTAVQSPGFGPLSVELLSGIVQRIVEGAEPERIILFGSYALGTPTPNSDLDLLIVMETSARPAQRVLVISRLLRPRPFPMDIIVRTPQEVEHALEVQDGFLTDIIAHGKVLYDRNR